jgi:hypothetical protein
MGEYLKSFIDFLFEPKLYFIGSFVLLGAAIYWRKFFSRPIVMIALAVLGTAFLVWAPTDPDFRKIITKGDNIPIVMLLGSVIFFTWLALRQAVINDERKKRGEPTLEAELSKRKVFTWPDLVYTEFICLILFTVALVVWSIVVEAPIEEPAATARTPNPSKAPWYFLGLQEMLVYFDPWIAGVVLPGFIIVGLCAIPYLDTNPKGNGYYTFEERPFAWAFFGPFEYWDIHKLEPLVNVDLSTYFWVDMLGKPLPPNPLLRESPGILSLLGFFLLLPPLLGKTVLRGLVQRMGLVRYNVFMHLMLWFVLLPLKMLLRWTVNLKYIVGIPEWFFNV